MDYFIFAICIPALAVIVWFVVRGRRAAEGVPPENAGETCFVNYLKHSDPLTGAVQDEEFACQNLLKAVNLKHPDATFLFGTLTYTGDSFPKDTKEGMRLMREGRRLGATMTDAIATSLGIDLDADTPEGSEEDAFSGENIGIACRKRIDELREKKQITEGQQQDLYELVRTSDQMHLINVLGILHNDQEMKGLAGRAGRISGWDAERGIFYLSPA